MTFYKYTGFWRRFIAFTIDFTIIFFVFCALLMVASLAFFSGALYVNNKDFFIELTNPASFSPMVMFLWIFQIFLWIIYFTYFHGMTGKTPGKMISGLQVVSVDGSRISFGTAFLRVVVITAILNLVIWVPVIFCHSFIQSFIINFLIFLFLGFIFGAFDKKKQGWHDKIAGTVVIIKEKDDQSAGITVADNTASTRIVQEAKPPENNGH